MNDYTNNHTLPLPYYALWVPKEDWSVADSCTINQLVSFMLSGDWGLEFLRDYVSVITEDEELIRFLLSYEEEYLDSNSPTILSDEDLQTIGFYKKGGVDKYVEKRKANITNYVSHIMNQMVEEIKTVNFEGSNSWVISGEHTKNGKPLISGDPHLGNGVPSIWHYSHVEYPDGKYISGASLPGLPLYPLFTTQNTAMTITAIMADTVDIYEEKIIGNQYEFEGKLYDLKLRNETIKIKGQPDKAITVRETRHGPIVSLSGF